MLDETPPPPLLRPHQAEALDKFSNGCVVAGGVGTGKTRVSLAYYVRNVCRGDLYGNEPMRTPKKLIVITTARKRDDLDWFDEGLIFGLSATPELSYGRQEFIVDSWNNIKKYKDETNCFFIFDEQRLVGSGAWAKTFLKMVKNEGVEWILLSATPADTWLDYVPLFLAHGFFRSRSHFIEEHVNWVYTGKYRQIRGFYNPRHLRELRDSILVEMPYERHTTRHLEAVLVEHDEKAFEKVWKRRWNVFEDVPLIDAAEMHRVARKVVNSDPDRMVKLKEVLDKHGKLIVFYNFDYELEELRKLNCAVIGPDEVGCSGGCLGSDGDPNHRCLGGDDSQTPRCRDDFEVAEWNGHKHQEVPKTDKWVYLVQYTAGSEAWNCIETNAVLYYSLTYSHKVFEQTQGRIDRLNTPFSDLYYYILMSDSRIDKLIWKSLVAKKNFHEGRNIKFAPEK